MEKIDQALLNRHVAASQALAFAQERVAMLNELIQVKYNLSPQDQIQANGTIIRAKKEEPTEASDGHNGSNRLRDVEKKES